MSAKLYYPKLIGLISCLALSFMTTQSSFACQLDSTPLTLSRRGCNVRKVRKTGKAFLS